MSHKKKYDKETGNIINPKKKDKRREFIDKERLKYDSAINDFADGMMLKSVDLEANFVKKTIEIAFVGIDKIDGEIAMAIIPRIWNNVLLGIVEKMEIILDGITEKFIDKNENKILTKKEFLDIIDSWLNQISSFDRV